VSLMQMFVAVLVAPSAAIVAVRLHGRAWFPIVAKALVAVVLWAWYFHTIDLEWFKEQVVFAGNRIPPEARAAIDELFTRRFLTVSAVVSELVLLALILAGLSTYLWLAGRDVRGKRVPFRQWVALVAWSSAPTFLVAAAMALIVLARGGEVLPTDLDPTTVNALFVGAGPTSEWAMWATSFSIIHVWVLGFIAAGFRQWTGRSWATSLAVVVSPVAIAYTLWAVWIAS
jgi:hypothetical protein